MGRAVGTGAERTLLASYDKPSSAVIISVDGSAREGELGGGQAQTNATSPLFFFFFSCWMNERISAAPGGCIQDTRSRDSGAKRTPGAR